MNVRVHYMRTEMCSLFTRVDVAEWWAFIQSILNVQKDTVYSLKRYSNCGAFVWSVSCPVL